jgi:hypothetical protein
MEGRETEGKRKQRDIGGEMENNGIEGTRT